MVSFALTSLRRLRVMGFAPAIRTISKSRMRWSSCEDAAGPCRDQRDAGETSTIQEAGLAASVVVGGGFVAACKVADGG